MALVERAARPFALRGISQNRDFCLKSAADWERRHLGGAWKGADW